MSEALSACKALAAMFRDRGEPTETEVTFVANAAMELGLDKNQNVEVSETLRNGGDYDALLGEVESRKMRSFLFRRVVAATLLDDKIEDDELDVISSTADAFGFNKSVVEQYIEWMKEGIAWERRGAELMSKM